jgi:hypothetical protein
MNFYQDSTTVVFDADDFAVDEESNALNYFIEMKALYPKFKVTLFTILGRWLDLEILKQVSKFDWIEFAAHGYEHFENDEVLHWDKNTWYEMLNLYEEIGIFTHIFKAPDWQMSRLGYQVLKDMGWAIAIRQFQYDEVLQGMKYYSFETNPFAVHAHTWTMKAHVKEGMFRNWSGETNFKFVSESLEEKI